MADERVTINDLRRPIAQQAHKEEAQVNAFLGILFPTIIEGLKTDKQVKVNGLGTFKLQWNEARKSVNVSTGEAIIIEGYNKLVFVPETSVRERINEPFAHLEAMVVDANGVPVEKIAATNPIERLSEQADEIQSLLEDINTAPDTDKPAEELIPEVEVPIATTEATSSQEPTETPQPGPEINSQQPKEETVVVESVQKEFPPMPEPTPRKKEKEFHPWRVAIISMIILLGMLVAAFFFLQNKIVAWADILNGRVNTQQTEEEFWEEIARSEQETAVIQADSLTSDSLQNEEEEHVVEDSKPEEQEAVFSYEAERTYPKIMAIETVNEGSRLTWISKKYYGKKELWVYIYEANRDKLSNPEQLTVGMKLIIPELPIELSDLSRPEAAKQAKELHDKYVR